MIQRQLKMRLNRTQERLLDEWLWSLTGAWNWAIGTLSHSPWRLSRFDLEALTVDHSKRLGIPHQALKGTLFTAHRAWERSCKGLAGRPHRKGARRRLTSIPFTKTIPITGRRATLPVIGDLRFHRQDIPAGRVKCGRLVKRASGWHLSIVIDADRPPIERASSGAVGIDPGFKDLLTLSTGEKFDHPRELEASARRLAQAQRGQRKRLTARLHERMANQRKDRNHKLSRDLVSRFTAIYFSKDNTSGIAGRFGKSVASSGHTQLRRMLSYKSRAGGTEYVEVESKLSTKTCSACGALSGPTGLAGLKVRQWTCAACGEAHDRDVNAATNTLIAGAGRALERTKVRPEAVDDGAPDTRDLGSSTPTGAGAGPPGDGGEVELCGKCGRTWARAADAKWQADGRCTAGFLVEGCPMITPAASKGEP